MYKGILIENDEHGYRAGLREMDEAALPSGDVTVRVEYSAINYKDALAITGRRPVVRRFPMTPGVDFAGVVEESSSPQFAVGDKVLLNSFGVGETHWGGLAQKARVNAEWLIPLPASYTTWQAAAVGTAGYTAMLCVMALEEHGVLPASGPVVVTGAGGGVSGMAIAILAKLGYETHAITGRPQESDYLRALGAVQILPREQFVQPCKTLAKERWAGGVDVVGSHVLANVLSMTQYGGCVAACGLAGGIDLPTTVIPFILRSVTLAGVDSVYAPKPRRVEAWRRLAQDLELAKLGDFAHEIALGECFDYAAKLIEGRVRGRIVVDVNR